MPQRTPLYDEHRARPARMAEFAGWEMPIQYVGAIEEHHLVRRSVGLFDVSHMARFELADGRSPADTAAALQSLVTADLSAVGPNSSTYALMCTESGGVVDDLFVYRLADRWLVVANAANHAKDARWLADHGVAVEDVSGRTAMIAVQGPRAIELVDRLSGGAAGPIERFAAAAFDLGGVRVTAGRTGYTGEDGVELFLAADDAVAVWRALLEGAESAGIECAPAGLAARDSLRFEPGFPLYGHELTEEITPIEARLAWACDLSKAFIGRDALRRQEAEGVSRRLATVQMLDRGVPREGFAVVHDGEEVGRVASGMYAPTVDAYCANLFVPAPLARVGAEVQIVIRDQPKRAVVVKRPLYTPSYR